MRKARALEMRQAALLSAQGATDTQALTMPSLYPEWAAGVTYSGNGEPCIVRQPGTSQLYRINEGKAHTSQAGWEPVSTPSLWTAIQGSEAGTKDDPIPAVRGMEYEYGLYYKDPEDGKTYFCARSGEAEGGRVVLQYLPHELIGQYFEEVPAT